MIKYGKVYADDTEQQHGTERALIHAKISVDDPPRASGVIPCLITAQDIYVVYWCANDSF
jgi:hypothetical protein